MGHPFTDFTDLLLELGIEEENQYVCPLEKQNNNSNNLSPSSSDLNCLDARDEYYCLHKENGNLSLRECNNIKNQQWIYSTSSGSCE